MTTKTRNEIKEVTHIILFGILITLISYSAVIVFHRVIAPIFDKLLGI